MMRLTRHSPAWYDRLSSMQEGYYYPWQSTLADGNGESAYRDLVCELLTPELDVLDAGCGHGEQALDFAPFCRTMLGYDRVQKYIDLAEAACQARGVSNAVFVCANSKCPDEPSGVRVPAPDRSIDLVISRRGPTHWIEDVPRFCRPGARLLQLNPCSRAHEPPWDVMLPDSMRLPEPNPGSAVGMQNFIERRLAVAGLALHSAWSFDVPEWYHSPLDLYRSLTFGEDPQDVPAWNDVRSDLAELFERHASGPGLEDRHRRFLWMAEV